jgi:hypothetical protein
MHKRTEPPICAKAGSRSIVARAVQIRLIWRIPYARWVASVALALCSGHLVVPLWESPPPAESLDGR